MPVVTISGSGGFVGTNLREFFLSKGFEVTSIKRGDLKDREKLVSIIEKTDLLINLAGANIINRWTNEYKKILYSSRIDTTKALIEAIKNAKSKPKLLISTSAVGIYKNKECYDEENFEYEDDFLSNLCQNWEQTALKANEFGVRVAIFRFGIVLGNGGALQKMLLPFKLGLGGKIGNGKQYVSFIHMQDLLNAYWHIYQNKNLQGIFNLTTPNVTTNNEMTKTLSKALKRPAFLPIPKFVLKLIFSEGAKVLSDGQCAKPKRLINSGFKFEFDTIDKSIENLI